MELTPPRIEAWLEEIKKGPESSRIGMYLVHNGVVRGTSRNGDLVSGMNLSCDSVRLNEAMYQVEQIPGIAAVRVWINEGTLKVGDDIMYALVAGDMREHVFDALQQLVRLIKTEVVIERETLSRPAPKCGNRG